jgi:hypothetical protein
MKSDAILIWASSAFFFGIVALPSLWGKQRPLKWRIAFSALCIEVVSVFMFVGAHGSLLEILLMRETIFYQISGLLLALGITTVLGRTK